MTNIPKSGGNFVLNVTNTTQTYTDTLYTDNKVVSGDIEISITAKTGTASVTAQTLNSGTTTLSGTTLTVQAVVTPSVSAGYVNSGNSGVVTIKGNVPVETKTITPSTSAQTIIPTSGKLINSVVVNAIATESKTVKSTLATATVTPTAGKYIDQVIVSPIVLEAKSVTPSASSQEVTPSSGKDGLSKVTVNAVPTETKSVKSTQATQTITPSSGKFISQVTVDPVVVQAKTVTPTTATQTISPDTGKDYLTSVKINAITVGTAGSPVATKGTVSGNKIIITPKVTNVEGYIASGTITGATIEVTAAELVSGTTTLTQQTGTNVTNYASANVRAASNFSLSATDNTGVVAVGTLASGYYPLTNSITASLNAGTPGWFSSGSANDAAVQVGKIAAATPSAEVSGLSSPAVAVSGAVTGMATVSSGSYYVQVNTTVTNGSVKAKYKNTQAGYAPANTGTDTAATTITPDVTGSGTKIYIKPADISIITGQALITGQLEPGEQIKITDGYVNETVTWEARPLYLDSAEVTPTTSTQTITFDSDIYDGLSEVIVYPAPPSETTELTVSAAGTFTPSAPYVGFNKVTVGAGSISVTSTSATTSLGVTPGSVSVANRAAAITGKTQLTVTPTTTAASVSTDYYVAVRPTAAAGSYYTLTPSTYTITADVTNAGYVDDINDTTITIKAYGRIRSNSKTGSTYYLPIPTTIATVTASSSAQTITPPAGYLISKVNVNALTVYDGSYDS